MSDNTSAPKPPIVFLLAVWNASFIRQFCELGLCSLLAPGNIPAMAAAHECTFIFLTRSKDRKIFSSQPLFKILEDYCRVQFVDIDDLIFQGNYSATVTLAYERGMRSQGSRMCESYFIYMVSDYIMADGSLKGLMRYIDKGYSGITAGNFQVVEEVMAPMFKSMIDPLTGTLTLPPRQLLAKSFAHLHPMTMANTVNQPYSHTSHSNRLFWRVDDQTLIGRFYLRHMLCIRPEIDDYVIGSSCDYSFIPEMCPSGNVAHISDSDDYCVVELQPGAHEQNFLRYGESRETLQVEMLSEWTTRDHRANAHTPVVFHSSDIPENTHLYLEESGKYILNIEQQLSQPPVPFRGHPYWISCLECCLQSVIIRHNYAEYYRHDVFAGILGSPVFEPPLGRPGSDYLLLRTHRQYPGSFRRKVMDNLMGMPSGLTTLPAFWHPYWSDSRRIRDHIQSMLTTPRLAVCIAYDPTWLVDWLHVQYGERVVFQQAELFLERSADTPAHRLVQECRLALIVLTDAQMHLLGAAVSKCRRTLPVGSTIVIYLIKVNGHSDFSSLQSCITVAAPHFSGMECDPIRFNRSLLRRFPDYFTRQLVPRITKPGRVTRRRMVYIALLLAAHVPYAIINFLGLFGIHPRGRSTSAIITLRSQAVSVSKDSLTQATAPARAAAGQVEPA